MTTTTTNNRRIRSPSLAKYLKIVQQANEKTAEQYQYRLCKFEKYVASLYKEEEQQQQQMQEQIEQMQQQIEQLQKQLEKIEPKS